MEPSQEAITRRRQEESSTTAGVSPVNSYGAVDHAAPQHQAMLAQTAVASHQTLLARGVSLVKQRLGRLLQRRVQTHYEAGWDTYARDWGSSVKQPGMAHVGDEWGSGQLTEAIVHQYVRPHLPAEAVVLEIGSGRGNIANCSRLCARF